MRAVASAPRERARRSCARLCSVCCVRCAMSTLQNAVAARGRSREYVAWRRSARGTRDAESDMDLLLFAALAVGYAVSSWELLRQSRLPRAPWEVRRDTPRPGPAPAAFPRVLRLHAS